jgi:hypothetical protein
MTGEALIHIGTIGGPTPFAIIGGAVAVINLAGAVGNVSKVVDRGAFLTEVTLREGNRSEDEDGNEH